MKPYIINGNEIRIFIIQCSRCGREHPLQDTCTCGRKSETSRLHSCVQFVGWIYKFHKIVNDLSYYKEEPPTACFSGFSKINGYGIPEGKPLSDLDLVGYMMSYLQQHCWKYEFSYSVENNIKTLVDEIIKIEDIEDEI